MILYQGKLHVSLEEIMAQVSPGQNHVSLATLNKWLTDDKVIKASNYLGNGAYTGLLDINEQEDETEDLSDYRVTIENKITIDKDRINTFNVSLHLSTVYPGIDKRINLVGRTIYLKGAVKNIKFKIIKMVTATPIITYEIEQIGAIDSNASLPKNSIWNIES